MEFVRTTHEPCGIYRCCGEEFEVDPATEENLFFNGEQLLPQCPRCGEIDVRSCKPPLWKTILVGRSHIVPLLGMYGLDDFRTPCK